MKKNNSFCIHVGQKACKIVLLVIVLIYELSLNRIELINS